MIGSLAELGRHAALLDGDNLRHGINRDLGFSGADRAENVRRVAEIAALFVDAGMIALVALISPFRSERALAAQRVEAAGTSSSRSMSATRSGPNASTAIPSGPLSQSGARGELTGFTGIELDLATRTPKRREIIIDASRNCRARRPASASSGGLFLPGRRQSISAGCVKSTREPRQPQKSEAMPLRSQSP